MSGTIIDLLDSDEDGVNIIVRHSLGSKEEPLELDDTDSSVEHHSAAKRASNEFHGDGHHKQEKAGARSLVKLEFNAVNPTTDERKRPAVRAAEDVYRLRDGRRQEGSTRCATPENKGTCQSRPCIALKPSSRIPPPARRLVAHEPTMLKRCPTPKQSHRSGATYKKLSGTRQSEAVTKPADVVFFDDNGSDFNGTGRAAQRSDGKSKENAICILSDDESDNNDDVDVWPRDDIRRPLKTVFASQFAQMGGTISPSKHSTPSRGRHSIASPPRFKTSAERPNVARKVKADTTPQSLSGASDMYKGPRRRSILGTAVERLFALGRNGTASFLGRRIQEKGSLKRPSDQGFRAGASPRKKRIDSSHSDTEVLDNSGTASGEMIQALSNGMVSTDSAGSRGTTVLDEINSDDEKSNSSSDSAESESRVTAVLEGINSDDEKSNLSSDSAESGHTGSGGSISGSWQSDGDLESENAESLSSHASSEFDDGSESDSSDNSMVMDSSHKENSGVLVARQSHEDVHSSSGFNPVEEKGIPGHLVASDAPGTWKENLDNRQRSLEKVTISCSDKRSEEVSNSANDVEHGSGRLQLDDATTGFVRRTTRKISNRPDGIDSSKSLEKQLAAHDTRVRGVKRKSRRVVDTPTLEAEETTDEKFVMHQVPHLFRTTYNSNGIPCCKFTVHTHIDDSMLYDFEVNIKQSKVSKDAGLGAFLVFRGVRVLERERKLANDEKMKPRQPVDPGTLEKLEATHHSGCRILVALTGKHLHGHNNSIWRPETEMALTAHYKMNSVTVKLAGDHLHYDIDEDEQLGLPCCPPGIGHLRMNTESEYLLDTSVVFSTRMTGSCALLELGRYGPARKEDRKRKLDFDVKCFLYDQEPSGWCYGLDDRFFGRHQIVDITDDATGEVHQEARKLPAIYVNEVGHDQSLIQNVHISQVGGFVQYHIDIKKPMKMGDEVELLCNYGSHYETTRERKGYGLENLLGAQKSDCDLASKLERNFVERVGILEGIEALSPLELFYNMEFISQQILPNLEEVTCRLAPGIKNPVRSRRVTPLQILARRRIHWLAPHYLRRIAAIDGFDFIGKEGHDPSSRAAVAEMRNKCQEWVHCMEWRALLHEPQLPRIADQRIKSVFDSETVEEVLFRIKEHLKYPMDVNLWCPIARDLISQLCLTSFEHHLRFGREAPPEELGNLFLECAFKAAELIRQSITESAHDGLTFRSGAEGVWRVKGTAKNLVILAAGSALSNSTVLKGAVSSLIDQQVCEERVDIGLSETKSNVKATELTCDDPVVIALCQWRNGTLDAMPRPIDFVSKQNGVIHEIWYLIWQVVYPVHAILTGLLKEMPTSAVAKDTVNDFLNELCRGLNVDVEHARSAIDIGIRDDLAVPQMTFTPRVSVGLKGLARQKCASRPKTAKSSLNGGVEKVRKIKENGERTGGACSRSMFFDIVWKALTGLGWTLVTGTRPSDFHFLPTGVQRGRKSGFKPRVDFFDSYKQVLHFLRTDDRWKDKSEVLECLSLYDGCRKFLSGRKIKGELKIEYIIEQVRLETKESQLQ